MELIDISRPEIAKAIELARDLVYHCRKNNFEDGTEIFGVALDAKHVKEKAYMEGKNYEKMRIASLLGLDR